jgi:hypothetical protein
MAAIEKRRKTKKPPAAIGVIPSCCTDGIKGGGMGGGGAGGMVDGGFCVDCGAGVSVAAVSLSQADHMTWQVP